ncbi:MAG: transcription factor S [Candidatus Heimdallarchaeota archaeon]
MIPISLFCDKCGALLIPVRDEKKEAALQCPKCGMKATNSAIEEGKYVLTQKIEHSEKDETVVIDNGLDGDTLPTATVECPKCGHNRASYWQSQIRSADEGMTLFYRCLNCRHTWRDLGT